MLIKVNLAKKNSESRKKRNPLKVKGYILSIQSNQVLRGVTNRYLKFIQAGVFCITLYIVFCISLFVFLVFLSPLFYPL